MCWQMSCVSFAICPFDRSSVDRVRVMVDVNVRDGTSARARVVGRTCAETMHVYTAVLYGTS